MLSHPELIDRAPSRRFMLQKTQHLIGGFSKYPGGPPDIYHGYLGLAALATLGESTLKTFDPALCVSSDTVRKIFAARRRLLVADSPRTGEMREFWADKKAVWPEGTLDDAAAAKLREALEDVE